MIKQVVDFVLGLGPSVMLPVILTVFGVVLGQSLSKSFRAGVTIGIGFVGIGLVVDLFFRALGPAAKHLAEATGTNLDVLDVGWPIGAAISFGTPVAPLLIPLVLILNVILIAINFTRTMDVDLWNYWHFIFSASVMYYATHNMFLALAVGCITAAIIFKLADWTAPVVHHHFGLPGISLPHTETVGWAPIMYMLNKITDRIPGLNKIHVDPETLSRRLGVFGEPVVLGLVLGALLGILSRLDLKGLLTLSIQLAAVMILLPRMVAILMEGLIPLSEGARDFISKRFPGKDVYIGLDAAIVIGHPAGMAAALLMVPVTILLAVMLPYNRMLPLADLPALPFFMVWPVATSRGNIVRGLINGVITLAAILFFATELAPLATTMGKAVGFQFPAGANLISGIDLGAHLVPWIVIKLLQPSDPYFIPAIIAALAYAAIWWWVRSDIRQQYRHMIEEASTVSVGD